MAQPNNKNNNNKRPRESFFKREQRNYRLSVPIDYISGKNKYQVDKVCKEICRDVAMGNLDPTTEYAHFTPALLDALKNFTYSKMFYYMTIYQSVETCYNSRISTYGGMAIDPLTIAIIAENKKSYDLYSVLYQGFLAMTTDGNIAGWLQTMMSQLGPGKYAGNI